MSKDDAPRPAPVVEVVWGAQMLWLQPETPRDAAPAHGEQAKATGGLPTKRRRLRASNA